MRSRFWAACGTCGWESPHAFRRDDAIALGNGHFQMYEPEHEGELRSDGAGVFMCGFAEYMEAISQASPGTILRVGIDDPRPHLRGKPMAADVGLPEEFR